MVPGIERAFDHLTVGVPQTPWPLNFLWRNLHSEAPHAAKISWRNLHSEALHAAKSLMEKSLLKSFPCCRFNACPQGAGRCGCHFHSHRSAAANLAADQAAPAAAPAQLESLRLAQAFVCITDSGQLARRLLNLRVFRNAAPNLRRTESTDSCGGFFMRYRPACQTSDCTALCRQCHACS